MSSGSQDFLVIVESPAKAKTIKRFLGEKYKVLSSMGHIVDLPKNKLGIELEKGFIPQYKVIKGKEKIARQIKKEAEKADKVYLATDPDREGEAISWHIKNLVSGKGEKECVRVVFHEITRPAIKEAFSNESDLNLNKVNAQQSRRLLDRIVGYFLSPFLWKRICRGLSAGRVQSAALKFIVDREKEIKKFVPRKYYTLDAFFEKGGLRFKARLVKYKGKKIEINSLEEAEEIRKLILGKDVLVETVSARTSLRKPSPPFITSSLQQEAYQNLHFSSSKTMVIAQRLYEGIELAGHEMTGLITYMRTDSFNVSYQAKTAAKEFIARVFGDKYLSSKEYKFKSKGIIQAAHEAIRPVNLGIVPDDIQGFLSKDEFSLYELIWKRFLASFMKESEFKNTKISLSKEGYEFTVMGVKLIFDGFLKVYPEKIKEEELPDINQGDNLKCVDIKIEEKTTNPPPRFNDASLVKLMEEKGIGRPSTYAPTIYTLISRNYMRREKGSFFPTDLGIVVTDLLIKFFSDILDENFTAKMEQELDYVEKGDISWRRILEEFFPKLKIDIDKAEENSEKHLESAGKKCKKCGAEMVFRWSKKGRFLSCSNYPKCKYAESIDTGVACPECKTGRLVERRNRKSQRFYGCSNFPKCRYTSSNLPEKTE